MRNRRKNKTLVVGKTDKTVIVINKFREDLFSHLTRILEA